MNSEIKKITLGILAHVDAGKTTLSESMLYKAGAIKKPGRVDHRDTVLDTDEMERSRGITIFAKQAGFTYKDRKVLFIDTPGHVDFSGEVERSLSVLDGCILLISGPDGVQSHTRTLFRLLKKYEVPTLVFVNKMDICHRTKDEVMANLQSELSSLCVDFSLDKEERDEEISLTDDSLLDVYMEEGGISDELIMDAVSDRKLFPVFFGAALKQDGIEELLDGLCKYIQTPDYDDEFGALCYKIMRDKSGQRLTFLKVTGGSIGAKEMIQPYGSYPDEARKINELRLYDGESYEQVKRANAGDLVAVLGVDNSYPGRGFGNRQDAGLPRLIPVLTYSVILKEGQNPHEVLDHLKILEDEDPLLHIMWNERLQEISLLLMGQIQLEILKEKMLKRFDCDIDFGVGDIVYKETIEEEIVGHGHFEPLRHFADVVIKMEPLPPNSGIEVKTECPLDVLAGNWQNQIINRYTRRELHGVLTNSPLTDIRITLIDGKSHKKHTVGGDFRKASEIAVRDGLLRTNSVLLEPHYHVILELPQEHLGRAMTDIERMKGTIGSPEAKGSNFVLEGDVPVKNAMDYAAQVRSYTGGLGRIQMSMAGYFPCHDAQEVIEEKGYDYRSDLSHPYESVYVHRENPDALPDDIAGGDEDSKAAAAAPPSGVKKKASKGPATLDDELEDIFTRTFGEVKRPLPSAQKREISNKTENVKKAREEYLKKHPNKKKNGKSPSADEREQYVLVDGYNVIFSRPDLKDLAEYNIDSARDALMDELCNYQGYTGARVIAVFDAYKVKNNPGEVTTYNNIDVVYTREAQTADAYIERVTKQILKRERTDVTVVSSDGMVQLIVAGHGALRISAREFCDELAGLSVG